MTSLSLADLPTRLDKYVRESTGLSRRKIEEAIHAGRVSVDAESPDRGPATLIFPGDRVILDQNVLHRQSACSYYMFHKPAGILTASSDPYDRPCLDTYLEGLPPRIFPVGRLDKDTTGLLLLTDDGDLAHMLLHPRFHIPKMYRVEVEEPLEPEDPRLERLTDGVEIGDGPARALSVKLLGTESRQGVRIELTIDEGRNRQVRRMVRAADLRLVHLHRHAFGELELDVDTPGTYRQLEPGEVEDLWRGVGGRERVIGRKFSALEKQAERLRDEERPHVRLEKWLAAHRDAVQT